MGKQKLAAKLLVTVGLLQLSVAVGAVQEVVAQVWFGAFVAKFILEGQGVRVGFCVSLAQIFVMETLKEQEFLLPRTSVAV